MKHLVYAIAIISCCAILAGKNAKAGCTPPGTARLEAEIEAQERALGDHAASLHEGGMREWLKAANLRSRLERARARAK